MEKSSIIFGPIPSRRFGLSLGIDLSPNIKQCNFDCLYCELQKAKTITKQIDSPKVRDIVEEVTKALQHHKDIDVITLTANGEPTLYPYLGELVDELNKIKQDKKLLILSNGSTIYKNSIFKALQQIDIVKLSLDCATKECFKKLDRADSSIDIEKIFDSMISFSKICTNDLIIEILFVDGVNTKDENITKLYDILKLINPTRVDVGTIDRPPAYDVKPVSFEFLQGVADRFVGLPVVITHKNKTKRVQYFSKDEIVALLKRRPLTKDDIENLFDDISQKNLSELVDDNFIQIVDNNNIKFYTYKEKND